MSTESRAYSLGLAQARSGRHLDLHSVWVPSAEIVVMAVMAVKFGLRRLSMRALKSYKSALEFFMRAARLNIRFCKFYMRAPKFYMRAPKFHMRTAMFYKRAPYLYLRKKKLFEGEEKNYIKGEILLYIFLFSLY